MSLSTTNPLPAEMELNIANVSTLQLLGSFSNALAASDFAERKDRSHVSRYQYARAERPGLPEIPEGCTDGDIYNRLPAIRLESYELEAIDYLVKPIRIERF